MKALSNGNRQKTVVRIQKLKDQKPADEREIFSSSSLVESGLYRREKTIDNKSNLI